MYNKIIIYFYHLSIIIKIYYCYHFSDEEDIDDDVDDIDNFD